MAATAAIAAATIAVQVTGFGGAKRGESSGGGCENISELLSVVYRGETVDKRVFRAFR